MVASREKSQPWSSLSNRRSSTLNELEIRVSAAEKTNQQILNDIVELKKELKLGANRPKGYLSRAGINDVDTSPGRDSSYQRLQARNLKDSLIGESLQQTNKDKVLQQLTADIQTVNSRVGSQATDIQNLYQELKNFDSKLENILRNELRAVQAETAARSEDKMGTGNRARPKDSEIERLEVALAQMETKLKQYHSDRLRFENNVHNRQSVHSELDDISNQLNQRVDTALEKIQGELATSQKEFQAALGRFSLSSSGYETRLEEIENGYKDKIKDLEEEVNEIREEQQAHQKKLLNSLAQLDLAVEVLEQGLSEEKEQLKGVVAAEIKARTSNICSMQVKLQELEDNVSATSSKLAISVREMQEKIIQLDNQPEGVNPSRGMPARTSAVTKRIDELEREVDDLHVDGQRNSESVQTTLRNIAEAIQAVKVGLLAKIEKIEDETNETIKHLTEEFNELKDTIESKKKDR
ncbi:hypothetical protein Aperf_G00000017734 [Anoplocephala perfoliata]